MAAKARNLGSFRQTIFANAIKDGLWQVDLKGPSPINPVKQVDQTFILKVHRPRTNRANQVKVRTADLAILDILVASATLTVQLKLAHNIKLQKATKVTIYSRSTHRIPSAIKQMLNLANSQMPRRILF